MLGDLPFAKVPRLAGPDTDGDARHRAVTVGDSTFVGAVHRTDPDHPQTRALIELVDDWVTRTAGKDRIMLAEGAIVEPGLTARESISTQRGESGLMVFAAREHGIEIRSLEEDLQLQVGKLLAAGHHPESVFKYYVLRRIPQVLRAQDGFRPDIDQHLHETIDMYAFILPEGAYAQAEFDRLMIRDYPGQGFPRQFGPGDEDWILAETVDLPVYGPVRSGVQGVNRDCNRLRRTYAASVILAHMHAGACVLATFGRSNFDAMVPSMPEFAGLAVVQLDSGSQPDSSDPP